MHVHNGARFSSTIKLGSVTCHALEPALGTLALDHRGALLFRPTQGAIVALLALPALDALYSRGPVAKLPRSGSGIRLRGR
ncbi:MAG: hypothetical protein D6723_00315 [Acidobacteria bacterium]|nr:MAG: hypothetical protein D6723_00315 [Acidobacteriota bacterium]